MSRNGRSPHQEEHSDESWLVPYADILTLLLALFIVLFATAKVDQEKFIALSKSFNVAFAGGSSILPGDGAGAAGVALPSAADGYASETDQLNRVKETLDQYIAAENLGSKLETQLLEDGLAIRIRETALFPSGSATLLPESRKIAGDVARMLENLPQKIVISGHTDNVPINNSEFQSNWDLGASRSLNFLKLIFSINGKLKPERFVVSGNSEYSPLVANTTEEGRARNRRVEILILRTNKVQK